MSEVRNQIEEILRKPYHWVLTPEPDGSWMAVIAEFPGCIATGNCGPHAFIELGAVAESWLEAVIANGQSIPDPMTR